ncbi:hypothetical protein AVEN_36168-1 [Araneus ventricosus]|uniref:Mos1 transposase HTH domain-containing protein n=1 Tax=Araneus ventricosus TaxID=182803 RepID=A0A4Y2EX68_ARAVE|nr:hypothetical protein AVEN_36168-1 [Araneus ventricosus]
MQYSHELHHSIRLGMQLDFCSRRSSASGKQTRGVLIAEHAKFEVRAVIRFLKAKGVNQREIHRRLQGIYGPNVLRNCMQPLEKRPGGLREGVKLLHDGTRSHTSNLTKA